MYYLRPNVLYFLLATAFLIVYLVTMFSWFMQRKSVVRVYEHGFEFKDCSLSWDEINSVALERQIVVTPKSGKPIEFPSTISEPGALARHMKFRVENAGR